MPDHVFTAEEYLLSSSTTFMKFNDFQKKFGTPITLKDPIVVPTFAKITTPTH